VLEVRDALPSELDAAGALVAGVYLDEGWAVEGDYADQLRDARRRAETADLLVAVDDGEVVATVTLALHGSPVAETCEPGEAEIRMLATSVKARGTGAATALVEECLRRARDRDCSAVRLSTQVPMHAAQRLYERLGFTREVDRDWSPVPGMQLLAYWIPLLYCGLCGEPGTHDVCVRRLELEPPRYCEQCRRRMVVQVHPTGWTARCVEHGVLSA